jgi:hypothetical protein
VTIWDARDFAKNYEAKDGNGSEKTVGYTQTQDLIANKYLFLHPVSNPRNSFHTHISFVIDSLFLHQLLPTSKCLELQVEII